jgi:hypothetical protein
MTNNDEEPAGCSGGARAAADALQTANGRGAETTHHEVPPRVENKAEEAADALFDSLPVDNGVPEWPRYVSAKVSRFCPLRCRGCRPCRDDLLRPHHGRISDAGC